MNVEPPADLQRRPSWLAVLPDLLFRPERPVRYIAVAWALSFAGSMLLSFLVHAVSPDLAGPDFGKQPAAILMFLVVILSPLIETLMMAAFILLLLRLVAPATAVVASAVAWGAFHSSFAPAWGLVIWWPFLIFSIAFVTWRERGFWVAVGLVALTHGLQNLLPAALALTGH
ncbi:hypothetical protein HMF7854_10160 [Sphingomonas ginkgonis]|uniref:CPBP family intramembrane metalloprotease n=1 Tax=Sphingomonas ginkgonis TaxID=2315330 RepID=A0A3S0EMU0_9SPHN|nr:hypothetical protein [Sphingomonas ginkgonis]RST31159.1 hypothetical protein HMF7854_10160 [Sphingomonas ginkgonis]